MKTRTILLQILSVALLTGLVFKSNVAGFQAFLSGANTPLHWANSSNALVYWSVNSNAPAIARESMQNAASVWSAATGGALKFAEGPGGIVLDWDATGNKLPDPVFLAYTSLTTDLDNNVIGAQIEVNALDYTYHRGGDTFVGLPVNGVRDANLDCVLVHEVGHALGLDHSDKNSAAIVGGNNPFDPPTMNSLLPTNAGILHDDDKAGIRSLYHSNTVAISGSPAIGTAPLNVSFDSANGGSDVSWDFGDGSTATGASPAHSFTVAGTYNVKVTSAGNTAVMTIQVDGKGKATKNVVKPAKVKKTRAAKK